MKRIWAAGLVLATACGAPAGRTARPAGDALNAASSVGAGESASPTATAPAEATATSTPTPRPSATASPVAETPRPVALPVTLTTTTKRGSDRGMKWSTQVATLHGLDAAAGAAANAVLADAADAVVAGAIGDPHGPGDTSDTTAFLSAVDGRYVTVHLSDHYYANGAAHGIGGVETFVFERATGRRLRLASFFRPGTLGNALTAMSRTARQRLPEILGAEGVMGVEGGTKPEVGAFERMTPLPEGLEVTFGSYEVAPYAAGYPVVVVPWSVLQPYLAVPPSTGESDVPYRDGDRLLGEDRAAVLEVVPGAERVQVSQYYAEQHQWGFAESGGRVVTVKRDGYVGAWRVVPCSAVPAAVKVSVALRRRSGCS